MMILKAKALAVGLMMAGGVAAPIATFYATQPPERALPAKTDLVPEAPAVVVPTVDAPAPAVVMSELAVQPTPKPPAQAALVTEVRPEPAPEPEPERKCATRQLQGVGSGAVLICDIQRTSIDKPTRLAPRDLPSPSGLLR